MQRHEIGCVELALHGGITVLILVPVYLVSKGLGHLLGITPVIFAVPLIVVTCLIVFRRGWWFFAVPVAAGAFLVLWPGVPGARGSTLLALLVLPAWMAWRLLISAIFCLAIRLRKGDSGNPGQPRE